MYNPAGTCGQIFSALFITPCYLARLADIGKFNVLIANIIFGIVVIVLNVAYITKQPETIRIRFHEASIILILWQIIFRIETPCFEERLFECLYIVGFGIGRKISHAQTFQEVGFGRGVKSEGFIPLFISTFNFFGYL